MKATQRITKGVNLPLLVCPTVPVNLIAYDIAKLKSHASMYPPMIRCPPGAIFPRYSKRRSRSFAFGISFLMRSVRTAYIVVAYAWVTSVFSAYLIPRLSFRRYLCTCFLRLVCPRSGIDACCVCVILAWSSGSSASFATWPSSWCRMHSRAMSLTFPVIPSRLCRTLTGTMSSGSSPLRIPSTTSSRYSAMDSTASIFGPASPVRYVIRISALWIPAYFSMNDSTSFLYHFPFLNAS